MNCVHICGKQKRESTSEKGSAFRFSGRNTAQENLEFLSFGRSLGAQYENLEN